MLDGQRIRPHQNFFDYKTQNTLAFLNIQTFRRLAQTFQEAFEIPGQLMNPFLIDDAGLQGLQLRFQSRLPFPQHRHASTQLLKRKKTFLIGVEKTVDPLLNTSALFEQNLFAYLGWIGFSDLLNSSLYFSTDQLGILQHPNYLLPNKSVQIILSHRPIGADASTVEMTIDVGTQAAIVVELALGGGRRSPIIRIPAFTTDQHSLQQRWLDSAPRGKSFIAPPSTRKN